MSRTPSSTPGGGRLPAGARCSIRTELRRQASRRRTQLALGFMVLLPLIILVAFQFDSGGDDDDNGGGGSSPAWSTLATAGGLNFALFTLFVSAGFLLVVVVALFCGDTVASEASWGSLRYLLAIPVPRARLLGVKLVVALAYSRAGDAAARRHGAARRHAAVRLASAAQHRSPARSRAGEGAAAAARRSSATSG